MTGDPSSTTLTGSDNLSLFCRTWQPADSPQAAVAIVHGVGEHGGRHSHVARHLVQSGCAVVAADLRGHGRSDGPRGHVNRFDDYLADVKTMLAYARRQAAAGPLFLLGHSMGGLIALVYALKHPADIAAVIASAPGLRAKVHVPAWKKTLGNVMSALYPGLTMSSGLDPATLSHDPAIVEAYIADPLVHDRVSARWYTEFVNAGEWAIQQAPTLSVPALLVQGGGDAIVDPAGAKQFFDRITLNDKQYHEYPGLYHEIFNEPEKQTVLGDVTAWLTPRLRPHSAD